MNRISYLIASLLVALCITPNFAEESSKQVKETQVKKYDPNYTHHEGDLKTLLETFYITKNNENKVTYSKFDTFTFNVRDFIQNKYKSQNDFWAFEIQVVPNEVAVTYNRYSELPNSKITETLDVVLMHTSVKFDYRDNYAEKPELEVLAQSMNVFVKVKLYRPLIGYTENQQQMILDSIKNNKPLCIKGNLHMNASGSTPKELRDELMKYGFTFYPVEINGEPIERLY